MKKMLIIIDIFVILTLISLLFEVENKWIIILSISAVAFLLHYLYFSYERFLSRLSLKATGTMRLTPTEYFKNMTSVFMSKDESILMAQWTMNYFNFQESLELTKLCENHFKYSKIKHPTVETLQRNNREKYLDEILSGICKVYKNTMFFKINPDWLVFFGKEKFTIALGKTIYEELKKDMSEKVFESISSRIKNVLIDFSIGSSNYGDQETLKREIKIILYCLYDREIKNTKVPELH